MHAPFGQISEVIERLLTLYIHAGTAQLENQMELVFGVPSEALITTIKVLVLKYLAS